MKRKENKRKKVLLADLSGVLLNFNSKFAASLFKEYKLPQVKSLILRVTKGQIALEEFFETCKKYKYFVHPAMQWEGYISQYSQCFVGVNPPMFNELRCFKENNRGRLVCITDTDSFAFYTMTRKSPEIFWLFRENQLDQFVCSYQIHSVKKEKNPFIRAESMFGFDLKDAAFVDDLQINLNAFVTCGGDPNATFLYKIHDIPNHCEFQKFLDRHFPQTLP